MNIKIGFLCSTRSWGGLEMNHFKAAKYFHENNFDVVVFCKKNSPIEENALKSKLKIIYLGEHHRYNYFFPGLKLKKSIEKNNISHLFLRSPKDLNLAAIAKAFSKKRFYLSYFMEMQLGIDKKDFLHTARFNKIDTWVCSTVFLKNQVLTRTKFLEKKIINIPPALNLGYFQQEIDQQEARKLLNLPKDKIILGLIGRIDPHKGQILLLKTISLIANTNIFVCFKGAPTLNEKSNYLNEIENFITENKLEKNVKFIPFDSENIFFYKAIDATIMASKSETFGMVSIESLASGTPLIGSDSGGTSEIIKEHGGTIPFESQNVSSLANAILHFIENIESYKAKINLTEYEKYEYQKVITKIKALILNQKV